MAATLSVRAYTGASAGTESGSLSDVELCAEDAVTGADVQPGTFSFERWLRLRVDAAPGVGVTNFWVENTGDLPDGVSLKFGVTDTPSTPVATESAIAVNELQSGRRYIFDTNEYTEAGDHTRYLVIQEAVAASAASGEIPEQALQFGWQEA